MAFGLALAVLPGACDVPTESPHWDADWEVPTGSARVGVEVLLPSGVGVGPEGETFQVELDDLVMEWSLSELCPHCQVEEGATVPKPAFTTEVHMEGGTSTDLISADLVQATVRVRATHDFGFDPIRPGQGETGSLELKIVDEETDRVLVSVTADGEEEAFPPGPDGGLDWELAIEPGETTPHIRAEVVLDSPEGDSVELDGSESLEVEVESGPVSAASARVDLEGLSVPMDAEGFSVAGVDPEVAKRVEEGTIHLDVDNPFAVGMEADLTIAGSGFEDVSRSFSLPPDPSAAVEMSLSGDELRSFLGRDGVELNGTALLTDGASDVSVEPGQAMGFEARLDFSLRMGG